jgi:hypothetical protein
MRSLGSTPSIWHRLEALGDSEGFVFFDPEIDLSPINPNSRQATKPEVNASVFSFNCSITAPNP